MCRLPFEIIRYRARTAVFQDTTLFSGQRVQRAPVAAVLLTQSAAQWENVELQRRPRNALQINVFRFGFRMIYTQRARLHPPHCVAAWNAAVGSQSEKSSLMLRWHLCDKCKFVKLMKQRSTHLAKNIVSRVDRHLARRLREARRETGLSTRAVAKTLPPRVSVSHTTIASYEKGVTVPPIDVLAALADLYHRPLNWFLDRRECLTGFRYWNLKGRVPVSEQRQFEAVAGKWIDAYFNLERHLQQPRRSRPFPVGQESSPQELAERVRRGALNLDDSQPVQNVVGVLESFSAWAMEIRASFGVDGAAARHGKDFVVVLNPGVANERLRMNAAHELAYLLHDDYKQELVWTDGDVEGWAYTFASFMLLPDSQLRLAFDGRSFLKLIQYKEKFGVSLAAMIFMAEKARIINSTTSRWLWAEMSRKGWRHNEPGYVWRDRAINFETMLECAIQTKKLTWNEAERVTGIREEDLRRRLTEVTEAEDQKREGDEPDLRSIPLK